MPESPLHSFARRHNQGSIYRAAFKHLAEGNEERDEVLRQLNDELNYLDIQKELKQLQLSIDREQHSLADRRVMLKNREGELLDAQRSLQQQQAALQLELASFEQEKLRAAEEQERLDSASDSLHTKQKQLNEEITKREVAKALSHGMAEDFVRKSANKDAFNALSDALNARAPLAVLRAIIENHCGGPNASNPSYNNWTSLHYAAWHGHDALCQLLVANGASVNERDTYSHYTPLDWALSRGNTASAEYLETVGALRGVAIDKAEHFVISERF